MPVPFYRYSYKTATSEMMTDRYRESKAENIRCVKYIEDENTGFYANAYKDNCVDSDGKYLSLIHICLSHPAGEC